MQTLYNILVIIHLLSWAVALGATVVSFRPRVLQRGVIDGIGTALITGLILAGMALGGAVDRNPPHDKLLVKLVIAAVALALAIVARRRDPVPRPLLGGVAGLIVVNVAIAVLWQ